MEVSAAEKAPGGVFSTVGGEVREEAGMSLPADDALDMHSSSR